MRINDRTKVLLNIIIKVCIPILLMFLLREKITLFYSYLKISMVSTSLSSNLTFAAILFSVGFLFKPLGQLIYSSIIYSILSVFLLIDKLYYSYSANFSSIFAIKQLVFKSEISSGLKSLYSTQDGIFINDLKIVLVINLIVIVSYIVMKIKKKKSTLAYTNINRKATIIFRIIFTIVCIIISTNKFQDSIADTKATNAALFKTMFSKEYLVQHCGLFGYHYYDVKVFIDDKMNSKDLADKDQAVSYLNTYHNNNAVNSDYTGIAKGKNVIVIQLEALENFLVDAKINGTEITPNINKFLNDNIKMTNFRSLINSGSTSDAEFVTNASLYPISNGSVYYFYPNNNYESITSLLKNKGYYTSAMHANDKGFWNREEMYKSYGFDVFEDKADYKLNDMEWNGLSDKAFFSQSVNKMLTYKQPFYSFMITFTSHFPYTTINGAKFNVGEYEGTMFGNYLKAANYTDQAFGEFIDKLKEENLYDNSIIAIYGDHIGVAVDEEKNLAKFLYNKDSLDAVDKLHRTNVIGGMRIPGVKSMVIDEPKSQIDTLPTIMNLLDIKAPYSMGNDIFSNNQKVFFKNGDIMYKQYYYSFAENIWYDTKTKLKVDGFPDIVKEANEKLNISDSIIKKDLLK